jgi:hypothetical protein
MTIIGRGSQALDFDRGGMSEAIKRSSTKNTSLTVRGGQSRRRFLGSLKEKLHEIPSIRRRCRAPRAHHACNEQWTSSGDRLLQDGRRSTGVRRTSGGARGSSRSAAGHSDEPWRPGQSRREALTIEARCHATRGACVQHLGRRRPHCRPRVGPCLDSFSWAASSALETSPSMRLS